MRTLRIIAVALFVMFLAAAVVPWPGVGGTVMAAAAPADPELGPMICGTSSYVSGTFVWTDYAYDDRGANTQDGDLTNPATAGGDVTYPAWVTLGNAADLIQLQIDVQTDGLHLLAVLETLVDPAIPILGVAFDTDANPATGAALLPDAGNSWLANGSLGVEQLVVMSSDGAKLWTYTGQTWSASESFTATVDKDLNVMKTVVPSNLLNTPAEGSWQAFGVLGIRNASGGSWLDGSEAIYDLAFVGDEPFLGWQDRRQADILSGALASSNAAATIDFAKLAASGSELADGMTPGFHTYLYHSRLQLGEGVVTLADGTHQFNGPYQPYLVYVPEVITEGRPLTISMHGANMNHMGSVWVFPAGVYLGTGRPLSEELYILAPYAPDGVNFPPTVLTVWPLARGETLGYVGVAEQDVLDVTDNAIQRLGAGPNRVTLMGQSMGGMGAFRLGSLYPDRWAAVMPVVGYAAGADENHPGPIFDMLDNMANLPVLQINGLIDPLVNHVPAEVTAQRIHDLKIDHRFWLLSNRGHDPGGWLTYRVWDQAQSYVRNLNPAHIVYRVDPSIFNVDPSTGLDLQYDSAYWVSGIAVRDGAPWGQVEVTSEALPQKERILTEVNADFNNISGGQDVLGPNPAVPPTNDTWHELSWVVTEGDPLPTSNTLSVQLTNISTVAFDLERAGIAAGEDCTINVSTDSAVTITLNGLDPNAGAVLQGVLLGAANDQGQATFDLPAGDHQVVVVTHATFVLSNLTISPDHIKAYSIQDHEITVSVKVTNNSIVPGTYEAVLQLNGAQIASKDTQKLDGGKSETVSFTVKAKEAGTYSIAVGELSGTFKIGYHGFMLTWIIGGIMAFVVIAGAIFFGWRSRKID